MKGLKFGWAEIDITPDKKVSLYGQFAEQLFRNPYPYRIRISRSKLDGGILTACLRIHKGEGR